MQLQLNLLVIFEMLQWKFNILMKSQNEKQHFNAYVCQIESFNLKYLLRSGLTPGKTGIFQGLTMVLSKS